MQIQLYDTTLRDGTQGEGVSLSCDDKLRIARKLDEFGMAYIEGGWPGSNPKDMEFFERAQRELDLKTGAHRRLWLHLPRRHRPGRRPADSPAHRLTGTSHRPLWQKLGPARDRSAAH